MGNDGGLRKLFQEHLPIVHWQSIETGMTGRGIPDTNGCVDGVEFWIEYKQTSGYTVTLRPEQIAWLLRRERAGGHTFVAVRRKCSAGPRRAAADELWLIPGAMAREARDGGLRPLEYDESVLVHHGGPAAWNWKCVMRMLRGEKHC